MPTAAVKGSDKGLQAMKGAAVAVLIYKPGIEDNLQIAAFLGAALLLDKKIIIIAANETEIPEKIYFLADRVVRGDDSDILVQRVGDIAAALGVSDDAPIVVSP